MDIHSVFVSQYRASITMLQEAIIKSPDALWDDSAHENKYWHIAYHTLFFTHLYLAPSESAFQPWPKGRKGYQDLSVKRRDVIYSKAELEEYTAFVFQRVHEGVNVPLQDAPNGFEWLPKFSRLELHLYNIRHIQHHTGQLADRLKTANIGGPRWVGLVKE